MSTTQNNENNFSNTNLQKMIGKPIPKISSSNTSSTKEYTIDDLINAINQGKQVSHILDSGVDINGRDIDGNRPLLVAIRKNNFRLVRYLLSRGADPNSWESEGFSVIYALDIALENRYLDIATELIKSGAFLLDSKKSNLPLLYMLSQDDLFDYVKFLYKEFDIKVNSDWNEKGDTIFHFLTKNYHPSNLEFFEKVLFNLVALGENPNIPNNENKIASKYIREYDDAFLDLYYNALLLYKKKALQQTGKELSALQNVQGRIFTRKKNTTNKLKLNPRKNSIRTFSLNTFEPPKPMSRSYANVLKGSKPLTQKKKIEYNVHQKPYGTTIKNRQAINLVSYFLSGKTGNLKEQRKNVKKEAKKLNQKFKKIPAEAYFHYPVINDNNYYTENSYNNNNNYGSNVNNNTNNTNNNDWI